MAWSNATAACDWTPVAVSCREPFCIPHYSQLLLRKLLSFSSVAAKTPFNKHPVFTEHNEATKPELVSWLITKSRLIWKVIPTDDFYDGDRQRVRRLRFLKATNNNAISVPFNHQTGKQMDDAADGSLSSSDVCALSDARPA